MVYGQNPRVGLSCLPLASSVVDSLRTEAHLNHALGIEDAADAADDESVLTKPYLVEVAMSVNPLVSPPVYTSVFPHAHTHAHALARTLNPPPCRLFHG